MCKTVMKLVSHSQTHYRDNNRYRVNYTLITKKAIKKKLNKTSFPTFLFTIFGLQEIEIISHLEYKQLIKIAQF